MLSTGVRWCTFAATAGGAVALGLSEVLSWPLVAAGILAVAAGSVAAQRVRSVTGRRLLRPAGFVAAAALAVAAVPAASSGGVLAATPVLALAVTVLQTVLAATVREARLLLLLGVVLLLAAAGLGPGPLLVLPLVVVWAAVLVGLVLSAREPGQPGGGVVVGDVVVGEGAAGRAPVLRVLAISAVVGLVAFLVLPRPDVDTSAARSALGQALGAQGSGQQVSAYGSGTMDLDARGDLPSTRILSVPAGSPTWWRAAVLDTYSGRSWTSAEPEPSWTSTGGPDAGVRDDEGARFTATPGEGSSGAQRTDDVRVLVPYPALVAPGEPTAVTVDGAAPAVVPAPGRTAFGAVPGEYSVTSLVPPSVDDAVASPDPLTTPVADAPADVQRYLGLPASVPQRVRDLGVRLAGIGAGTDPAARAQAVHAVEEHLRSTTTYTLDAPVPAPGADAVDTFLFVDHEGFCQHYAAAEVVLLRSAGVPARVVTGFAYGQEAADGRTEFLASNAHAWVEVWVPGQGWATSDPTPAAAVDGSGSRSWVARAWSTVQIAVARVLDSTSDRLLTAGVLVLLAVGVAFVLVWRRRRGVRTAGVREGSPERRDVVVAPLLLAVADLDAALTPDGWGREPVEGLRTWAQRLSGLAAVPLDVPAVVAALEVAERACYARSVPSAGELSGARGALVTAAGRVLAARERDRAGGSRIGG